MAAALPLILAVAPTLLSAGQQQSAGAIAKGEAKVQARQAELGAVSREADRKAALADALASQNASAGARGIAAFEGSPLTILQADIDREEQATQRDIFSTELEAFTLKARGSQAKRKATNAISMGLLQAGSSFVQTAKTPKG